MQVIDITPTWQEILPTWIYLVKENEKVWPEFEKELRRMAQAADNWNAHCKEQDNVG